MGLKEDVLALAEELEAFEDGDCEKCILYGQPECKSHLPCIEVMARYAARKMRGAVERDGEGATTASAYDLLSEEDRKAIAWVRKHGGLDSVKKLLDWVVGHCSTKQQLDFDFWLSGRVMHELGFEEDMADRDEVESRLLARLMPEGMEWPTVDGKPVVIGERMRSCGIDDCKVVGIDPANSRLILASDNIEEGKATYFTDSAEYCHRPAPKVLDADGAEIREGDTVWTANGLGPFEVTRIVYADQLRVIADDEESGHLNAAPKNLTHRAPVLDADGVPLREGEMVYSTENGDEFTVIGIDAKSGDVHIRWGYDFEDKIGTIAAELLTHRAPVLAADGKPLEVGQTVWRDDGEMLEVLYLRSDGLVDCCGEIERPERLTHEQPETRRSIADEIGEDMVKRIDAIVSAGRWS